MSRHLLRRFSYLEAHHRLAITGSLAILVFIGLIGHVSLASQLIITWDVYAVCLLILIWIRIFTAVPRVVNRLSTLQHASRTLIFGFVLTAACASMGAVGYLLSTAKGLPKEPFAKHVLAAIGTVILSWLVVHTIFALQYAYLFYCRADPAAKERGLQFPEGECFEPDFTDFAYFSFVIGMTSQVSDVQISCQGIRRWALLHGMISFAFNAAILALSINVLSGLF